MHTASNILVIEDNPDIAALVTLHLQDLGAHVTVIADGADGLERAQRTPPDLIVLDLMLPGMDGLEVCRRLRASGSEIPIVMVTAKDAELDRVLGLEMGADDYVVKPFSIRELIARVKAVLRRSGSTGAATATDSADDRVKVGELEVSADKRTVTVDGEPVALTAREFDLLWHFIKNPGRVYTRTQLLDQVWGYGHDGYEHTVNSHINRLRAKIEKDPSHPHYVLTQWGVGYKFNDQAG